jgi:hypothetical protein
MLRDLRSVKMRSGERAEVDRLRACFQKTGAVSLANERWLHDACRRYAKQIQELHEARDRARRTNSLRTLGMTKLAAERLAAERDRAVQDANNDLGF